MHAEKIKSLKLIGWHIINILTSGLALVPLTLGLFSVVLPLPVVIQINLWSSFLMKLGSTINVKNDKIEPNGRPKKPSNSPSGENPSGGKTK